MVLLALIGPVDLVKHDNEYGEGVATRGWGLLTQLPGGSLVGSKVFEGQCHADLVKRGKANMMMTELQWRLLRSHKGGSARS